MAGYDVERFESLILPHLDSAYTLARYLLRDEHDAQDAVQDAALRALRHFDGFQGGDPRAWLLAIVRNCCYTRHHKRDAERSTTTSNGDDIVDIADPRAAADAAAIARSERARVRRAIDALPSELREVIVLRELEQLSYEEISRVIQVPIGTVMSRLSRARRRLAALLGGGAQEAG